MITYFTKFSLDISGTHLALYPVFTIILTMFPMQYSASCDFLIAQRESISFQSKSLVSIKMYVTFNKRSDGCSGLSPSSVHSPWQFPPLPEAVPELLHVPAWWASIRGHLCCYLADPNFSNKSSSWTFYFLLSELTCFASRPIRLLMFLSKG